MSSPPPSRFARYRQALAAVSARTGAPLPSLILSFGILHELTSVVPLVGIFYGARSLGVGERVISAILEDESIQKSSSDASPTMTLARQKVKSWLEEGDRWAIRVGRRYGVFGYEKRSPGTVDDIEEMAHASSHIAGDVANAIFAYGATKVRTSFASRAWCSMSIVVFNLWSVCRLSFRCALPRPYTWRLCSPESLLNLYGKLRYKHSDDKANLIGSYFTQKLNFYIPLSRCGEALWAPINRPGRGF
jgi:hypothetical protein